jgi:hypothetical protein
VDFGDPTLTAVGVAVLLGQVVVMLVVLPELGRLLGWRRSQAAAATVLTMAERQMTGAGR